MLWHKTPHQVRKQGGLFLWTYPTKILATKSVICTNVLLVISIGSWRRRDHGLNRTYIYSIMCRGKHKHISSFREG